MFIMYFLAYFTLVCVYTYIFSLSPTPRLHQVTSPDRTNIDNGAEPNITEEAVIKQESATGSTSGITPVIFNHAMIN